MECSSCQKPLLCSSQETQTVTHSAKRTCSRSTHGLPRSQDIVASPHPHRLSLPRSCHLRRQNWSKTGASVSEENLNLSLSGYLSGATVFFSPQRHTIPRPPRCSQITHLPPSLSAPNILNKDLSRFLKNKKHCF